LLYRKNVCAKAFFRLKPNPFINFEKNNLFKSGSYLNCNRYYLYVILSGKKKPSEEKNFGYGRIEHGT